MNLETMIKTIENLELKGKRVLVRVDFNVPIDDKGNVKDDFRIKGALPTIKYALGRAKQIVLMSHMDPWKNAETKDKRLRMDNVSKRLSSLIGVKVGKVDDCINIKLPDDKIVLLENLRFHKEEKKNDGGFARKLAKGMDVYINDAFGTCHRKHASVFGIVKYFDEYGAGFLVKKEIEALSPILKKPKKPFYLILGGTKIGDKMGVIENLYRTVEKILIGGKMALAFADADYIDKEERAKAKKLFNKYRNKIVLPCDYVLENKEITMEVPEGKKALDVGPKTIKKFCEILKNARTIVWNGPLGYFEKRPFDNATNKLADYLASSKAFVVVGGGDTADAVRRIGLDAKMGHVSTGGGASLEFLEGKELPGLKVLEK